MAKNYNSEYSIQKDILAEVGGDTTKCYDSPYEIQLAILEAIQGGGGGGAVIDDDNVSTGTTYSSSKIMQELAGAGFDIEIVEELPEEGDLHTIYFLENEDPSTGNIYDEWMFINNQWEMVGTTGVDLSGYATLDDISTFITANDVSNFITINDVSNFAQIDDNNVSTGTTYSSKMIEGEYYYDISNGIQGQINMWALQEYAKTLSEPDSTTVYLRDDNMYFTVDSFPLSSAQTYVVGSYTTEYVSNKIVFYNTKNADSEITEDGRYLEIYICYYNNSLSTTSGKIYAYWPQSNQVDRISEGTNVGSQWWMMELTWYGWNNINTPANSDSWGWFKYTVRYHNDMIYKFDINNYGWQIWPTGDNIDIVNDFMFKGTTMIHNGGFVKNGNFITPYSREANNLYEVTYNAAGIITGKQQRGTAWNYSINGTDNVLKYWETDTNGFKKGDLFIPTTPGTAGQYLTSNGSGEPVWQDLEVASDFVISDADASDGIYSVDVSNFYAKTIEENIMQGVQIKISDSSTISSYAVEAVEAEDPSYPAELRIFDGSLFAVADGKTARCAGTVGGNFSQIVFAADGTFTGDTYGHVTTISDAGILGWHVYRFDFNGGTATEGPWLEGEDGDSECIGKVTLETEILTADSYYLPSSSRIYEGNVELWLMFTEDGQSWENRYYLITDNAISRDISTGYFGCDPQVLADVSTALDVILNGSTNA